MAKEPHPRVLCATVRVLGRARLRVVDADGKPISGARLVIAPIIEVMETEEGIDELRRGIDFMVARGWPAFKFAIGKTGSDGVAELLYTSMTDIDDPLFDVGKQQAVEEFAFGTFLRIDSTASGTVFVDLRAPKAVRYQRPSTVGSEFMVEAEFVVRGDRQDSGLMEDRVRPASRQDAIDALDIEVKAREASREGERK